MLTRLDDPLPVAPVGRIAPDTHRVECQWLALQERIGCDPLHVQAFIWLGRAFNAAITAQAESPAGSTS